MVIMRNLKEIQKGIWLSRLKGYFNVRLAIIEVRPGETREDSWKRHLLLSAINRLTYWERYAIDIACKKSMLAPYRPLPKNIFAN